jgi:hypothetical protein
MAIGDSVSSPFFTRRQIESTEAYAKGLLRIIEEDDVFGVVNSITGQKFISGVEGGATLPEIIRTATEFGLTEFRSILGASTEDVVTGLVADESPYQRLSDIVASLNEAVFNSTDEFSVMARQMAGIEDLTGSLQIERFGFMHPKELGYKTAESTESPLQAVVGRITASMKDSFAGPAVSDEFIKSNPQMAGLLNIQKDAAVLLRFKVGDKYLTSDQINRLLVYTGSEILDPAKLAGTLQADETEDLLSKIGSTFGKGSKRIKAHTSDRSFTMGSEAVSNLVTSLREAAEGTMPLRAEGINSLSDAILVIDNPFEAVLKTLGLQDDYTDVFLQNAGSIDTAARAAAYRQRAATRLVTEGYSERFGEDFFKTIIKSYTDSDQITDEMFDKFKRVLSGTVKARLGAGDSKFGISEIVADISSSTDLDQEAKNILTNTINTALKKTQDGSQFFTDAVFEAKGKEIQSKLIAANKNAEELKNISRTRALTSQERNRLANLETTIKSFKSQFSQFAIGDPLDEAGNAAKFTVRELDNQTTRVLLAKRRNKIRS